MLRRWTVLPATYLVAIVGVGLTVVPLLCVVVDGFRTNGDINNAPAAWRHPWVGANYTSILTSAPFWHFLGNSALIATVATALTLVLGSMAALALSQYDFRGREFFYTVFVPGLLFPIGVEALPLLVLQTSAHFTLPLGSYTFQTQYSQNDAGIMAFAAMAMLPALAVFVFAQRYIVAGAAGAVKG